MESRKRQAVSARGGRVLRFARGALLSLIGCALAAWLGEQAGRYFQLTGQDFRPAPAPHLHVSGPTYFEAADAAAHAATTAAQGA